MERPHTAPLPISILRIASMPALCPVSLLSDSRPLPPLLVPSNMKKQPSRLSIRHHLPPPFRAPSQRGRRCSWVGVNTGPSGHRLRVPSTARSSFPLSSPTPQQPPNSDAHNLIPTLSPLLPTPQPPSTTPLTCVFRHARPRPYPLSPFQSNAKASHSWLTVSASRVHRVGVPCSFFPVTSLLLQLKYVTSIQYCNIHISSSVFYYPFPHISTTKLVISYLCFQAPPLFFSNSFVRFHVFSMLDRNLTFKNKIKVHSN